VSAWSLIALAGRSRRVVAAGVLLLLTSAGSALAQQESLADYARKLRVGKSAEVRIYGDDVTRLFRSMDEISKFASQDSGFAQLGPIRRKLVGKTEAEKHFRDEGADRAKHGHRVDESEVVLKKFGLLPAAFSLNEELGDITLSDIAGFYDPRDRTMYLLNWIAPEMQKMVMAHELTHALQDQNYHLEKFESRHESRQGPKKSMTSQGNDRAEMLLARRAMVEGQATLVGEDYEAREHGINLTDESWARDYLVSNLESSYDLPVTIHNAPRLLRETMIFPYREGLIFELALFSRGGREMAFRDAFRRPPVDTHQILQPEAYLKNERPQVVIGDLTSIFGKEYEAYDSGTIGEFDVQIMSEEFGRENDIYSVARQWNGGSYVAMKRAGLAPDAEIKSADLALVYLSRWKSRKAGERFAQIYLDGLAKRIPLTELKQQRCLEDPCGGALWEAHASSSEGPVHIELWPGNLVIVTQSVDDAHLPALRPHLLAKAKAVRAAKNYQPELSSRLFAMPRVQALSNAAGLALGMRLRQQLVRRQLAH
jgi:hypothetical protein